ncbi:unnamed protein product [Allacma fusca]|uniref:(+)RNA virus helicase C-terminal domain-containing protein n=1 Tax=Allacma fusca TaxID=39272 RepID=A0A8J2JQZ6_9HEXA|nr:unnamed protein product [Allacma fusca]
MNDCVLIDLLHRAATEQLSIWYSNSFDAIWEAHLIHSSVVSESGKIDTSSQSNLRIDIGVYNTTNHNFIIPPNLRNHKYLYDGANLIKSDELKSGSPQLYSNLLIATKETRILSDFELYFKCKNINLNFQTIPRFKVVNGVPGCGKTTYILNNISIYGSDLVLFPTREGANDFKTRLSINHQMSPDHHLMKNHYRTIDSFLMSNSRYTYNRLFVDEAFMLHFGQIVFAAAKSCAKSVILIGDCLQIPYINRSTITEIFHQMIPTSLISDKEFLSISYRCSTTVSALLFPLYEHGMFSTSNVKSEIKIHRYINITSIPRVLDTQYLTFTQQEKEFFLNFNFPTNTIHEFQGKQSKFVIVIRYLKNDNSIYHSLPHVVVALSRHTKQLVYYTVDQSDLLSSYIHKSLYFDDAVHEAVHIPGFDILNK